MNLKQFLFACLCISLFSACKKDPSEPVVNNPTTGSISLEFENKVDTNDLILGTQKYLNANGDTFTVSLYRYYVSNIKFYGPNGAVFAEPNSYHLVDQSVASSLMFSVGNVPFGNYTSMSFVLGVDSARNVSGVQSGALDPAQNMFWDWNSGYIMAKLEGTSPQSGASNKSLTFHVGGFSGPNNVLKTMSPSFNGATANVTAGSNPEVHLSSQVLEWFRTPNTVNFATDYIVHMPGTTAKNIADNYADMFTVEHIHN